MAKTLDKEKLKEPSGAVLVRFAVPSDYAAIERVIADQKDGGWPGIIKNTQHDIVAMTCEIDDQPSPTTPVLVDKVTGELVGVSLNLIRASGADGQLVLYVHMLAVDLRYRDKGSGSKLMQRNYDLIQKGELRGVERVLLTSDPLESVLTNFYFHRFGLHSSRFKPDLYIGLSETGGEQHKGVSADRLLYESTPKSDWVIQRTLPSSEQYRAYMEARPESYDLFDPVSVAGETYVSKINPQSDVAFVEVVENFKETKDAANETAILWRTYQKVQFQHLFASGHTAVDYVKLNDGDGLVHHFVVTMRRFDENNPVCLLQALGINR